MFNEISQVHTEDETDDESIDESYDDIFDADISEMEVKKAIQHLKCGKAAGPDGILAEMIKTAEHEITPYLTKYFTVLFANAKFPLEWSKAILIPLHKKGDVNDPGNYRGISLSSILTHIFNSRLTLWAESNFVLTLKQGSKKVDPRLTISSPCMLLLGDSGGVVNSLDFCPASLKSLGCFYFRCILSSQWIVNLGILHCQL